MFLLMGMLPYGMLFQFISKFCEIPIAQKVELSEALIRTNVMKGGWGNEEEWLDVLKIYDKKLRP